MEEVVYSAESQLPSPARYDSRPMIVRGPGAAPEVTAAGVFPDLLRLAALPGATQ